LEAFEPHLTKMGKVPISNFEMELKRESFKIVFGGSCFDIISLQVRTKKPEQNEIAGGHDQ